MTGERLKELLSSLKISQTDIAKKLGLSQQSFNQMLSASDVKSSLLERVANAIGMSISTLYDLGCCSTAPDKDIYGGNSIENKSKESDLAENIKDERIKLLEEKIAFLEEQVDFYKNKA